MKVSASQLLKDLLIAAIVIFGGLYILLAITSTSRQAAPAQATAMSSVAIGSEGRINNGSPTVPISIDQDLKTKGPVFFVNEDTEVRVSESVPAALRVRILTGPQKGRVGWVPPDWVKPLK